MKRILFVFCLCLNFSLFASQGQFSRFVVFGDSLSDTGNLYRYSMHVIPKSPPYFHGHFSNGDVWPELLAKAYFNDEAKDALHNYAFGGAGAVISKKENLPYTLWHEVNDYLYLHHDAHKNTTLYVVWMGANNYLNGPQDVEEITSKVVNGISKQVEKLIHHGAVMMVLANLPDLGIVPQAHADGNVALLSKITERHNQKLKTRVNELKKMYPNVHFVYLDAEALFKEVEKNPSAYGITNQTTPCYDGGYFLNGTPPSRDTLKVYFKEASLKAGEHLSDKQIETMLDNKVLHLTIQNGYASSLAAHSLQDMVCKGDMFWDSVHPTTYVHQYIANFIKKTIDESGLEAK